ISCVPEPAGFIRAFSSEVGTGSRQENASNQESRALFRFHRNGNGSSRLRFAAYAATSGSLNIYPIAVPTADRRDHARRSRTPRRRDQAVSRAAEESSLTSRHQQLASPS